MPKHFGQVTVFGQVTKTKYINFYTQKIQNFIPLAEKAYTILQMYFNIPFAHILLSTMFAECKLHLIVLNSKNFKQNLTFLRIWLLVTDEFFFGDMSDLRRS